MKDLTPVAFFDPPMAASCLPLDKVVLSDDTAFDRITGLTRIPITEVR